MYKIGQRYTFTKTHGSYFVLLEFFARYPCRTSLKKIYKFKLLNNVPQLSYFTGEFLTLEEYQLHDLIECDIISDMQTFFYS